MKGNYAMRANDRLMASFPHQPLAPQHFEHNLFQAGLNRRVESLVFSTKSLEIEYFCE